MNHSHQQKRWHFLAGASLIMHLVGCVLAPWFHQHPEQDHPELKGNFCHSHAWAATPHAQGFAQDHHGLQAGFHLLEGHRLFDEIQVASAVQFEQILTPGKFAL